MHQLAAYFGTQHGRVFELSHPLHRKPEKNNPHILPYNYYLLCSSNHILGSGDRNAISSSDGFFECSLSVIVLFDYVC